jgi:4-amino-4-deoxy-L-arabinose transferase-like glycosyltransferase
MTTLDTHETQRIEPTAARSNLSLIRLMLFCAALIGLGLLGMNLPEDARPAIFGLLVISVTISVAASMYRERIQPARWLGLWARWQHWVLVQRVFALATLVCMALAAFAFRPMRGSTSETAFGWFVIGTLLMGVTLLAGHLRTYTPAVREPLYERLERWRARILAGEPVLWRALRSLWKTDSGTHPVRWRAVGVGLLCIALVLQINIFTLYTMLPWFAGLLDVSHHLQMVLLIGGALLVVWGMMGVPHSVSPSLNAGTERAAPLQHDAAKFRARAVAYARRVPKHRWALLAILVVALFARLWDLELWSTRFLDELHYMSAVSRLRDTSNQQILAPFSSVTAFTWMYPYGQYLTTLITGANFTGVRLLSALFGLAQVGAVYFLGKQVFNRRVALVAAAVLATLPAHVHFSRIGIGNIADPLTGILALGFLARGIRTGQQRDFALAGFWLGWTQYFYEGGRLFYPPFVLAWLGWLLLFMRRGRGASFPTLRNLLVLVFTAAVLIVPVWQTLAAREVQIAPRFDAMRDANQRDLLLDPYTTWVERLRPILNKIPLPMLALVQIPDESWFLGGTQPFVLTLLVPFFLLGIALCLWRIRTAGGSLIFWWIASACMGIALISDSLSSPRYLVMLPAVALAIAVGVVGIVEFIFHLTPQRPTLPALRQGFQQEIVRGSAEQGKPALHVQNRIFFAVGAFMLLFQGAYYALIFVPEFYLDRVYVGVDGTGRHISDTDDVLLRSMALPYNTQVIILSRELVWDFNMNTVPEYWQRPDITINHMFLKQFSNPYIQALPRDRNYAFFLEDDDPRTLERLDWYFDFAPDPTGSNGLSPYRLPLDVQLRLYFAPATEPPKLYNG